MRTPSERFPLTLRVATSRREMSQYACYARQHIPKLGHLTESAEIFLCCLSWCFRDLCCEVDLADFETALRTWQWHRSRRPKNRRLINATCSAFSKPVVKSNGCHVGTFPTAKINWSSRLPGPLFPERLTRRNPALRRVRSPLRVSSTVK